MPTNKGGQIRQIMCKDCKLHKTIDCAICYGYLYGKLMFKDLGEDFYCALAEPKEEKDET